MKTDLVKKWSKTGLLEKLTPSKKVKCAASLEKLGCLLLKKYAKNKTDKSEIICGVILPIMRRLYDEKIKIPTAQWLLKDFLNFNDTYPEFDVSKRDIYGCQCWGNNYDPEVECVNEYVKNVSNRLKL